MDDGGDGTMLSAEQTVTSTSTTKTGLSSAWANLFGGKANLKRTSSQQSNQSTASKEKRPPKKVKIDSEPIGGPVGLSKAARSQKAAREAADRGVFDFVKREKWKKRILQIDPKAEFYDEDLRGVRCSNCSRKTKVPDPSNVRVFEKHHERCKAGQYDKQKTKVKTARTSTLTLMGFERVFSRHRGKSKPAKLEPCPGLSKADDAQIPVYLKRTAVNGGGSRSVTKIATELFAKPFRKLSKQRKTKVRLMQNHEQQWRNDHFMLHVFATTCTTTCNGYDPDGRVRPCHSCQSLLKLHAFQTRINVLLPEDENYKYVNKQF